MKKAAKNSLSRGGPKLEDFLDDFDGSLEPKSVEMFTAKASRNQYGKSNDGQPRTINGELNNLVKGVSPFESDKNSLSVETAIKLCQRAYWNVPIFRNTIDIQSEFANSKLRFRHKNKRLVNIYSAWYKKVKGFSISECFFREWFRSGNVFIYRFDGEITLNEYRKISKAVEEVAQKAKKIPIAYTILDPGDMRCSNSASFLNAVYEKVINKYELEKLKNPKTQEEIEFFNSLDPENQKEIKSGNCPKIVLDQEKLSAVFCGKQHYEGLSIPMYYSVLPDIDLKLEFKKIEKIIARTVDYSILLVTAGSKERDMQTNGAELNQKLVNGIQALFQTESVGRVLVSDYTTNAKFVMPELNNIFGAEKYKVVNEDIANGLMNIFWGEEKFANSMVKIKVFLERLNSAREAYLNYFLIPEMERVKESLGLSEVPTPVFEEVDLKDEIEYMKIYSRLAEIGVLTPEELFDAFETQQMPLYESSKESQEEYKKLKDKGLYEPAMKKVPNGEGRPGGTKAPQKTKKVAPIGASDDSKVFSITSIKDTVGKIEVLQANTEDFFREKLGMKRLSKKNKDLAFATVENIIISESPELWNEKIKDYYENPIANFTEQYSKISDISDEHGIDLMQASILFHSRKV